MTVKFDRVTFQNITSMNLLLTVEAPIGNRVYGPNNVGPDATMTISVNRNDCPSTAITITDDAHGNYTQTFAVAQGATGRQSYLKSVDVQYDVAEFWGSFVAGTDAMP